MRNRTLKFRAWSYTESKFYTRVLVGDTETDDPCSSVWNDEKKEWVHFDKHCGVIQQFTGLKDKNSKEIYEGDILEIQRSEKDNAFKKYSQVGVVDFSTGTFSFYPKGSDNENYYTFIGFHELFHYNEKHLGYYAPKIIGNVFENSELLKQ